MKIDKVHLLFEQSGTFKKAFKNLGINAEDYDIQNEFGETDHIIDLFGEIEKAYDGKSSIFDTIGANDLIFAFFPCIRFNDQAILFFRGDNHSQLNWSLNQKMECDIDFMEELASLYKLVNKLFLVCVRGGYRLIMENPYSEQHFLKRYWCFKPSVIDRDRRLNGDYFKKPTQYYFLNCKPEQNVLFEALPVNEIGGVISPIKRMAKEDYIKTGTDCRQTARSMIHPDYADRFIRQYITD